ncbi:MAG: hypothetical protein KF724_03175 [Phycisphaeraceae bacterium]|nr:hypothetical protein [Phycisphaeraceae bacterium]
MKGQNRRIGPVGVRACSVAPMIGVSLLALAAAGAVGTTRQVAAFTPPLADYGDAPVGSTTSMPLILAYPGVLARWVTNFDHTNLVPATPLHDHGTWLKVPTTFRLGTVSPTATFDSTQTPSSPDNDAVPQILLYAVGSNPIADIRFRVSTTAGHPADGTFYFNLFIDQNRDGAWRELYNALTGLPQVDGNMEHAVRDIPITMGPGETRTITISGIRVENPLSPLWVRMVVSNRQIGCVYSGLANIDPKCNWPLLQNQIAWDGTMIAAHDEFGEIEDHYLEFSSTYGGPNQPGIFMATQVLGSGGGGNGGQPPKPECIIRFRRLDLIVPQKCPVVRLFNLKARRFNVNGGCNTEPVLFGMYGPERMTGVVGPPTIALNPAATAPGGPWIAPGAVDHTCADGTVLTLPGALNGLPLLLSSTIAAKDLSKPPLNLFTVCFDSPPRRYRAYKVELLALTCGSVHENRSVNSYPASAQTSAAIVGVGATSDEVTFGHGDLIETFISVDPAEPRPFPDPDFLLHNFILFDPLFSEAFIDPLCAAPLPEAAPFSLRLVNAAYHTRPTIPKQTRATMVEFWTAGEAFDAQVTSTSGMIFFVALPTTFPCDFVQTIVTLPDDFELDSITISMADGWVDEVVVRLDGIEDCNQNGRHDAYDIAMGLSMDSNHDGIPDECQPDNPCDGWCGSQSPSGCWCDPECLSSGDCCPGFQGLCPQVPCAADLTGDGQVSGADIAIMLGAWGACSPPCPADINKDGSVNGADLAILLGAWGPCPQ